jgi:hypothetical protein
MMLDLLLLTRHLPSSGTVAPPPLNAPVEGSDHSSKPKTTPSLAPPPLAAVLLDVLFAVLVDAPEGVRVFERAGGLEIVRKVLKSKSVVKEVRCVARCSTSRSIAMAEALIAVAARSTA